jgi:sulfur carrier protein
MAVSPSMSALSIVVNGAPHVCRDERATVADLIAELALTGKRVAVEKNGEIVPRSRYAESPLIAGDRLEIIAAVGGG